jgi:hypothetical protein
MYVGSVDRRTRIIAFGSAVMLVLAGVLCGVLVSGLTGALLAIVLNSLGLGGVVLLLFLEVGLSEDRDRAREAERLRQRRTPQHDRWARRVTRLPRRPG